MQLQPIGAATIADAFSTLVSIASSALTRGGAVTAPGLTTAAPSPFSLFTIIIQVVGPPTNGALPGGGA